MDGARSRLQHLSPVAQRGRARLRLRATGIALGTLALLLAVGTARAIHRNRQVAAELAQLRDRIGRYQSQNAELTDTIRYLSSDEFVAVEARRSLGLGQPGELPVVVRAPADVADGSSAGVAVAPAGPSLPQLWWRYFFGDSA